MSEGQTYDSMVSAKVMAVCHYHQPVTKNELVDILDVNDNRATQTLSRLWRNNLLVRRKRPCPSAKGPDPFEYRLPPGEDWKGFTDEQ